MHLYLYTYNIFNICGHFYFAVKCTVSPQGGKTDGMDAAFY